MRTIQRMIRRSKLKVEYSRGFNPHINMSIAQPLSVGIYSCGEYMDLNFEEETDENEIKEKLNENAPMGIRVFEVNRIKDAENKKIFKSMAEVYAAKYVIKMRYLNSQNVLENMKSLINKDCWNTIKKTKRGESEADIKKFIKEIKYSLEDNTLVIDTIISCGSRENLSVQLLSEYIQQNTENPDKDAFIDIKREEMYGSLKNELVPLYKYVVNC